MYRPATSPRVGASNCISAYPTPPLSWPAPSSSISFRMNGAVIRHEEHQAAVHRVINAVWFDAERRSKVSKSEDERTLWLLISALIKRPATAQSDIVGRDILTDRIFDSWLVLEGP